MIALTSSRAVAVAAVLLSIVGHASASKGVGAGPAARPAAPFNNPALPGAPEGLVATAGDHAVTLEWSAPVSGRGPPVSGYTVAFAPSAPVSVVVSGTTAAVSGLDAGVPYTFEVRASNAVGEGPAATAVATPFERPGAPRSLVATAGDGSAHLSWDAPSSDGGAAVERYVVTVTPDGGVARTLETISTSIDVTDLVNRMTYVLSVAAVNAAGAGPAIESGPVIPRSPASAVLSSVLVDPAGAVTADGVSAALVTVVVRDAEGFALAGQEVVVAAAGLGNTLVQVSATTNADGIVTATLASTVAEEKALTVTVNGVLDLLGVPTVRFVPGPVARLWILQRPPVTAIAGVTLAPALSIAVEDARRNRVPGTVVTLSVASGPAGGGLLGSVSAAASAGVATFDAVRIELAGTYVLQAAVDGVAPVICGAVSVKAAAPTHLTFDVPPGPIRAGDWFSPAVKVGLRDPFGNLSSPGPLSVTVQLAPSADPGVLTGWTTRPQMSGAAAFPVLSVDEPGTYALVASAPGFADVTSASFAVRVAWELVSPEGGDVRSVAVAPDGSIVYALTFAYPVGGRVWRSIDGGATWERASAGLWKSVFHVAADPTSTMRAYVASLGEGLWVTESGGWRWRQLARFWSEEVAVGPDGTVLVIDHATIKRSTDHGITWGADVILPSSVSCFGFDPSGAATVYAGTWSSGVYRSSDGGASWSPAGALASAGYPSPGFVRQIAVDPGSPGTVWAATGHGLFRSVDAGSTWTLTSSPWFGSSAVVFDPSVPSRLYAIFGGVQRSDDGGGLWVSAGISSVDSLFPVPGTGGRPSAILADGIYQDAMFRLPEGGTWQRTSAGLRAALAMIAVHPADPGIVLAGHRGVERTTDGGLSWAATTGVPLGSEPSSMAFDPFDSSRVLAAGSGLFESSDGGVSWVRSGTISGPLLFDRANQGTVLAAHANTMYRSVDGGASWAPSDTGFPSTSVRFLVQDPVDPRIIIAATWSSGLYRSFDGGATWAGMTSPSTNITALSIDPRDDRVLLALSSNGVSRTNDGGATWELVATSAPFAQGTPALFGGLAREPGNPDVLLAGAVGNLYRSEDGGATWKAASSGYVGGSVVYQILFAAPGVAYVSSSTGVYRTTTGGQ
jgi:photosystem II stability/assembly factor-like uncharacterized protein